MSLTKISFLGQLYGEPSRDLLQLIVRVELWVYLDSALGATEWYGNASALVCHERRKRLHLIGTDILRITNTYTQIQAKPKITNMPQEEKKQPQYVKGNFNFHTYK